MKKSIFLFIFSMIGLSAFSQNKNSISLTYGFGANEIDERICDCSLQSRGATVLGINYEHRLGKRFYIESGVEYFNIRYSEISLYPQVKGYDINYDFNINLISFPLYAKFTFYKYFFAGIGASVDFDVNNQHEAFMGSQTGLKSITEIGGKYAFKNINLIVSLNTKSGQSSGIGMNNYLVKFSVGYSF